MSKRSFENVDAVIAPALTLPRQHLIYNPLGHRKCMQTVAETPLFIKQAAELFSDDERKELIDFLAANPQIGDDIPGTGGVRKVRFGAKGKGKRGGARVIYYWYSDDAPIYALLAYGKNEKVDLKPDEAKAVAAFAKAIKAAYRSRT
ncbi:type II toxin-antitoxin system RelE/ParE family toxin [Mesorhizobium sp. INR15]|uniref:type II toxin-antitoxin system RelE/ParE family toxin n=1 Tax=Mesorhizobium sp. INR15 TaxID=2654248 RepID=UPI0027E3C8D5|nr:type II toxin-antitoxin system RelE/ParE family toxin [Mesorhizobium sp. INR15]